MTFLIVGGGSIGRRHIANLRILGYHDIFCLKREYDKSFETSQFVKVITSVDQISDVKIDAVFVCSPTSLHFDGLSIACQLGASVLMEKPFVVSREHLTEAKALYEKKPVPFFIGFMLRYHPLVRRIKEVIASEELGKVYSARFEFGSYLPYWHPWEDHRTSYASRRELGGGVVNTITHDLDLVQYLFGAPKALYSSAGNFGKLGIEVEEVAESVFEYDDKIVTLHLDYLQKDYDRCIRILCDGGKIVWNWHENAVHIMKHKSQIRTYQAHDGFEVNDLYTDELVDFLKMISDDNLEHPLNFSHAISNTELLLATHQSITEGRKIPILL